MDKLKSTAAHCHRLTERRRNYTCAYVQLICCARHHDTYVIHDSIARTAVPGSLASRGRALRRSTIPKSRQTQKPTSRCRDNNAPHPKAFSSLSSHRQHPCLTTPPPLSLRSSSSPSPHPPHPLIVYQTHSPAQYSPPHPPTPPPACYNSTPQTAAASSGSAQAPPHNYPSAPLA